MGWTQQHLADLLGYDVKYIGQIERSEKSPTLTTLMALSGAFGVPLSELIKSAESRLPKSQLQKH
jgi:transcriptional regulator with XRE-family HTH domain